jgi:hypothetical protein
MVSGGLQKGVGQGASRLPDRDEVTRCSIRAQRKEKSLLSI